VGDLMEREVQRERAFDKTRPLPRDNVRAPLQSLQAAAATAVGDAEFCHGSRMANFDGVFTSIT